jgi:hypothetical protein
MPAQGALEARHVHKGERTAADGIEEEPLDSNVGDQAHGVRKSSSAGSRFARALGERTVADFAATGAAKELYLRR